MISWSYPTHSDNYLQPPDVKLGAYYIHFYLSGYVTKLCLSNKYIIRHEGEMCETEYFVQ